jgi:hypothetical protein
VCQKCKDGSLIIIYNRKTGKRFVGCTNYKNGCNFIAPLPQKGTLQNTGKVCDKCGWPVIQLRNGRIFWKFCINPECPSKVK